MAFTRSIGEGKIYFVKFKKVLTQFPLKVKKYKYCNISVNSFSHMSLCSSVCMHISLLQLDKTHKKKNCHHPLTHQYVPLHTPTILLLLCFQVIKRQLDTYGSPAAALAIDTYGSPPKTDPCTLEVSSFIHNGDFLTNCI